MIESSGREGVVSFSEVFEIPLFLVLFENGFESNSYENECADIKFKLI